MSEPKYDPFNDYYEILGIREDATPDEIKSAYRIKAKEVHPDKGGSSSSDEEMKYVNSAWEILYDPFKRKVYNQSRFAYFEELKEQEKEVEYVHSESSSSIWSGIAVALGVVALFLAIVFAIKAITEEEEQPVLES